MLKTWTRYDLCQHTYNQQQQLAVFPCAANAKEPNQKYKTPDDHRNNWKCGYMFG